MRVRLACLQDNLTRVCIPACRGKLTACDIIDQTHIREYIVFVAIKPLPRGANGTGGWREACYASVMTTQRAKRAISMSIAAIAPTARIDVPRAPTALKRARPCLQGRASSDIAKKTHISLSRPAKPVKIFRFWSSHTHSAFWSRTWQGRLCVAALLGWVRQGLRESLGIARMSSLAHGNSQKPPRDNRHSLGVRIRQLFARARLQQDVRSATTSKRNRQLRALRPRRIQVRYSCAYRHKSLFRVS